MSMKNSSDTIGNRTRDLPACSALPQPTARDLFYNLKYNTSFVIELHDMIILNIFFIKIQREGLNWNVLSYNLGLQGVL